MGLLDRLFSFFRRPKRERVDILPVTLELPSAFHSDERPAGPAGVYRQPLTGQKLKSRGLTYFASPFAEKDWIHPQYDHYEIEVIYDVESYFARATRAKLALFLREGFEFVGANEERVKYIRTRFQQMERVTGIKTSTLLYQTCRDLVVHANAYWLKVRNIKASGGKTRTVNGKEILPVAGYFPLPPETMVPQIDQSGTIIKWKQEMDGVEKIFSTDDIVHFYTNKKVGYPLGVPSIIPVKDDIRALRSIESNIDVLIHKHLFPIILWRVGTKDVPARTFADGTTEIDLVQEEVANMPTEGSLVVSERYDVQAIGVENKALRVESYLEHFRSRLLAGLDVSSVDVGIGDTSSRSTAQTLSRNLIDTVKLQQNTISAGASSPIEELLLESTFDEATVLNQENLVSLNFLEIDKESQIANANHLADLFLKNVITHPELRNGIGREPLTPEEEKELWWEKFGKKQALIASVDESSGLGTQVNPATGGRPSEEGNGQIENKNTPANQHGERKSPKLKRDFSDSYATSSGPSNPILRWHNLLKDEIQARWVAKALDLNLAEADIRTGYNLALKELVAILKTRVRTNYPDPETIHGIISLVERGAEKRINRLVNDIVSGIRRPDSIPLTVFDALKYRTILIFDTELSFAGNIATYKWITKAKSDVAVATHDDACEICRAQLTVIKWDDKLGEARIPPHHPLCRCRIEAARKD